jgi:hypothetical protein
MCDVVSFDNVGCQSSGTHAIIGDWFGIEQVGPTNGPLNYKELILELDSQQGLVGIFLFHLKMISLDFGVKMIKIEGVNLTFALFTQRE